MGLNLRLKELTAIETLNLVLRVEQGAVELMHRIQSPLKSVEIQYTLTGFK